MNTCLISGENITPFMTFGQMPIANGFLAKNNFEKEYYFEMEVAFSNRSKMFQLINQPNPEQMFNENYAFYSGTSTYMANHFRNFSNDITERYLKEQKDPFIVEIGCNDGIMLKHFAKESIRHLGIEPSANVAKIAVDNGIQIMVDFFNTALANKIVAQNGKADVFIAANVMCHIPTINSVVEGIKELLKEDGVVIFEDPYLGDVIQKTTYDQIYDEHTFIFSVHSVQYLFNRFEMEVINVEHQITHGGSMRYTIANKGRKTVNKSVNHQLTLEKNLGLDNPDIYQIFKKKCEVQKANLIGLLNEIKSKGKSIAGYAATSKSTTIINYCDITVDHLDCIYDTTPIKHGKFSPGAHIPIQNHNTFKNNYPDYALLFGYNHEKEIMAKETEFINQGGKWITYVPDIKLIK